MRYVGAGVPWDRSKAERDFAESLAGWGRGSLPRPGVPRVTRRATTGRNGGPVRVHALDRPGWLVLRGNAVG